MGFSTAVDSSDAAPSTTLLNAIETLLTANAAWSLVETVVSGTFTCRVWKCSGAVNSFGSDWFLILRRTTASLGTSTITATACESYDSTGHLMTRHLQGTATTSTPDATFNACTGATTLAPGSANFTTTITTSTVTFTYWILVTKNGVHIKSSIDASYTFVGLYIPFFAADWPTKEFPLCAIQMALANSAGSSSRAPGTTVSTASVSRIDISNSGGTGVIDVGSSTIGLGTIAAASQPDVLNSKPRGRRIGVSRFFASSIPYGVLYDTLYFAVAAGVAVGDTITIGANTWVCLYVSSTTAFFVNQAAT